MDSDKIIFRLEAFIGISILGMMISVIEKWQLRVGILITSPAQCYFVFHQPA